MTDYEIPPWRCLLGFHAWGDWHGFSRQYASRSCQRRGCRFVQRAHRSHR